MTYSTYETMHDTPMHLGLLCLSAFFFLCDRLLLIMISIISVFPSQFQTVSHCSHRHIFRGARFVIALFPIFIIYIYIHKDSFSFFALSLDFPFLPAIALSYFQNLLIAFLCTFSFLFIVAFGLFSSTGSSYFQMAFSWLGTADYRSILLTSMLLSIQLYLFHTLALFNISIFMFSLSSITKNPRNFEFSIE